MNNIRLVKPGKSRTLQECSDYVNQLHQFIGSYTGVYEWYTSRMKKVDIKDEDNFKKEILNYYKLSIKRADKISVGDDYVNPFENFFSVGTDKLLERFTVTYKLGSSNDDSDVLMGKNLNFYLENQKENVLDFFEGLITRFCPSHGTVTNDYLSLDAIDFSAQEIWTGWMTYLSDELEIEAPVGFNSIRVEGLGNIILVTNDPFDNSNSQHLNKVKELTEYLRQNYKR